MLQAMFYLPGAGLGKYHQGVAEMPDFHTQDNRFGLGYKPTKKDLQLAGYQKSGYVIDVAPKRACRTLNGYFIKEGEDFLYNGFPERWVDPVTKKQMPGFEIFFDDFLPRELFKNLFSEDETIMGMKTLRMKIGPITWTLM